MRRLTLLTIAAVFCLSACAGGRSRLKVGKNVEGEVVEAEGLAPHDAKDMIATKRASLVDAQRNAVEKAVGVYVSARTLVEKAVAIENNILAKTDGYVKKYDILSEGPQNGLYHTRIRALVALKEIEQDLRDMALTSTPELKRPRVTIEIKEELNKESVEEAPAASALARALQENGFTVVRPERAKEADLAIRGKAAAYPYQAQGLGGFVSYRARLSVEAVRPGAQDVLATLSREASGLGGNTELAGLKSLETVGELVGRELSSSLPEAWSRNKRVLVFVEGVKSFSDAEAVRKHLQAQPGVNDLVMRRFDEQMAQFEIELGSADAGQLAASLENSRALPMKVVEAQAQTLRVQLP